MILAFKLNLCSKNLFRPRDSFRVRGVFEYGGFYYIFRFVRISISHMNSFAVILTLCVLDVSCLRKSQ